jgi:hypothetical protein
MAFNEKQRQRFNEDYKAVTGVSAKRFVCPISLRDDPNATLCDGHILNKGIQTATRKTVVQWTDIDNYYGHTIEPDLIAYLNMPVAPAEQLMRKGKDLTVKFPSGEAIVAFITNKAGARAKFPQIDLIDPKGDTVASPFLRTDKLDPQLQKGLKVEWLMSFTDSALLGSILKSAYLALWNILGYRYVFMASGDCLRRPLANFFKDRVTKAQSVRYFSKFKGAVNVFLNEVPEDHCDTVNDGLLWFHLRQDVPENRRMFAVSCLFRVNQRMISVMVPYCAHAEDYRMAYSHYQRALKDRNTPQDIHFGYRVGDRLDIYPEPLSIQRSAPSASENAEYSS